MSIERFFGILNEHWRAPIMACAGPGRAAPINDELVPYTQELRAFLERAGIRTEVDDRTESLNKKIREAQLNYIPLIVTIGEKEKENSTLSVRTLDGNVKYGIPKNEFIVLAVEYIRARKADLDLFRE
ncbi:MAG: His/Gly/Thr/Pro-type tRNA ligase C-terminal domain-containing protein [Desulfobacterales bacterium]